jgi:hypothetical protein
MHPAIPHTTSEGIGDADDVDIVRSVSEPIVVYTAMYGAFDDVPPPVDQNVNARFICVTDTPSLTAPGWEVVVHPARYAHPRMASKVPKMCPRDIVGDIGRWAVWVDANVLIDNPAFAREAVGHAMAMKTSMTTFRHPQRDCIYLEAEAAARLPKCRGVPVLDQVASYRIRGHPERGGLFGCRSIVWDLQSDAAAELGRQWLEECERWTYRDQLSLPVVARRLGIAPGVFPHHLFRHRPFEAVTCRVGRSTWGRVLLDFGRGTGAGGDAEAGHPVPRRWWTIGNPWFDVMPHRRDD